MAAPESEIVHHDSATNNETTQAWYQMMPDELKAAGWKLSRVSGKQYRAKNEKKHLYSHALETPEEAIDAARRIDAGESVVLEGDLRNTYEPPTATGSEPHGQSVPIARIRTDGGTQPRETLDQETVDRYAEEMIENYPSFPPIVVFHDGSNFWLADGFHRFFAFRKAFGDSPGPGATGWAMSAEVRQGTQRDAVLYSLSANTAHGLPRSNADKRRAVLTLLGDPEWAMWSDNVIARKAGVSQPYVSSLRRELTQNVLSDKKERLLPPPVTTRIGSDRVARDTTNIGRKGRVSSEQEDEDIIAAENDIRVDGDDEQESSHPVDTHESTPAFAVTPTTPADIELWQNGTIELHLRLNPEGKANPGTALVSGKHTHTNAVFLSCTAAELQPLPPALKRIVTMIQEAFETRGKSQPAATKPKKNKTTVARGKKKATKRPTRPITKKKPTRSTAKKKPATRPKPRVKARKK